ncbi:hypothetical protein JJJ17_05940 [Paracoccus caeni]|uniref:Uncharacterized protein n=1 Tax=Paracoccus caeni TaxID=657651 RepID=A0A934SHV2_9RHOB|nr:hypothetical protein [Paracoccus caeni]MBK4215464.1 hypothetical protein [Paracoccus caeni]
MKHGDLRSVAHDIADSLASGVSLMTGAYDLTIFDDAARSEGGMLTVDLLCGKVVNGQPSRALIDAVARIPAEFDRLCRARGASKADCRRAMAYFYYRRVDHGITLVVEDSRGKVTETDYSGIPAHRVTELDALGRRRRKPVRKS